MNVEALKLERFSTATTDSELVSRAIAGREESFEELVIRYQRPISSYIYRLIGNYDTALDLTQEVFIKVYNCLSQYCSDYKFSTWIYKIAHNTSIDHMRRSASRVRGFTTESDETYERPVISHSLTPEQESERAERLAEIETVVSNLPDQYKELILLRHAQDFSYDEIAEITGLPLGTVKNRIFRAREIMRQEFLQRGITSV
jgi:RNA polymerase sigma-70 factor, ECF subfamily